MVARVLLLARQLRQTAPNHVRRPQLDAGLHHVYRQFRRCHLGATRSLKYSPPGGGEPVTIFTRVSAAAGAQIDPAFVIDQMLSHILHCLRAHPGNQDLCRNALTLLDNLSSAQASKNVMMQLDTAQ